MGTIESVELIKNDFVKTRKTQMKLKQATHEELILNKKHNLMVNHLSKSFENEDYAYVFLDMSKAFDRVNRNELLTSLVAKGISLKWTQMIINSHENTWIITKINGKFGQWIKNN